MVKFGEASFTPAKEIVRGDERTFALRLPSAGLHFSLHPSGVSHVRDKFGFDEPIDLTVFEDYSEETLIEDASQFLYWPDLSEDTTMMPVPEWIFTGLLLSANHYGIYLDIGKMIRDFIPNFMKIQRPKHLDSEIFNRLSSPTLFLDANDPHISLWHPAMEGLPPINIDTSSKWAGIEKTTFGRALVPSLDRIVHRFNELSHNDPTTLLQTMGFDPSLWRTEAEKLVSNLTQQLSKKWHTSPSG